MKTLEAGNGLEQHNRISGKQGAAQGDLRSGDVARSGDRATTGMQGDRATTGAHNRITGEQRAAQGKKKKKDPKSPEKSGRDKQGQFTKGNPGGPGNPFARRTAQLRRILCEAVSEQDMEEVAQELIEKAKGGELGAIKLLLSYTIGKPGEAVDPDTLDTQELEGYREACGNDLPDLVKSVPSDLACLVMRAALPGVKYGMMDTMGEMLEEAAVSSQQSAVEEADDECEPSVNGGNGQPPSVNGGNGQSQSLDTAPSANGGNGEERGKPVRLGRSRQKAAGNSRQAAIGAPDGERAPSANGENGQERTRNTRGRDARAPVPPRQVGNLPGAVSKRWKRLATRGG